MTTTPTYGFEDFWRDYDKKTGKDKCITKWALISPTEHLKIKIHVPGFVSSKRNKQYRPNPLSYLNGKMWLDEGVIDEDKIILSRPKQQKLSEYEPKPFDNENHKNMRNKLRANFEHGAFIKDYGDLYTDKLTEKCGMTISDDIHAQIVDNEYKEANRHRNRFEEPYPGSIETNVRDKVLNYWLSQMREQGIDVSKKI